VHTISVTMNSIKEVLKINKYNGNKDNCLYPNVTTHLKLN